MTKNKFITFLVIGAFLFLPRQALAQSGTYVVDPECESYLLTKSPDDAAVCNSICEKTCITSGRHCSPGKPEDCISVDLENVYPEVQPKISKAVNVFGIDLCPTAATGPDDDPYCILILVRLGFYAFFSVIIFLTLGLGLWVVWVRSTAADSPEKVEKAVTIAKNAITGLLIVFLFLAIVQVSALLTGLTESLFDVSIVPQPREVRIGTKCRNVGYVKCMVPSHCKQSPVDFNYYCLP